MWQEEALQADIGASNALCPKLLEISLENSLDSSSIALPIIIPDWNTRIGGSSFTEFSWQTAVEVVQSPASLTSEGSCTTSLSECPGSPHRSSPSKDFSPEKSMMMSHPASTTAGTQFVDDDPDAISPPSANSWWAAMLLPATQPQASPSSTAMPDLETLGWSDLSAPATTCDVPERLSHSMSLLSGSSTITEHCHQHLGGCFSTLVDPSLSTGSTLGGLAGSSVWNQVLLGGASGEAMQSLQNCSVEGLQDLLYSRAIRQAGGDFLLSDQFKKMEEIPAWELPVKNFTFQGDEMSLPALEKSSSSLPYSQLIDDRLSSTSCGLPDIKTWSAAAKDHNNAASQSASLNAFSSGLDQLPSMQVQQIRVKQEYPVSYGCTAPSTTNPFWLQGYGVDSYKGDLVSSEFSDCENKPLFKGVTGGPNLTCPSMGDEFPGRWISTYSSRFPVSLPQTLPAGSILKNPSQILALGRSLNRQYPLDLSSPRPDVKLPMHGKTDRSSTLQYVQQSVQGGQVDEASSKLRPTVHIDELKDAVPNQKRPVSSVNSIENSSEGVFKRPRVESAPSHLPFKQQVRKEKLGDRITALQQLVSPFGKTDTASVLLEAIEYIKFLQEQVQVLSTPYMKSKSTATSQNETAKKSSGSDRSQDSEEPKHDLRSRGLCLIPVSCMLHVANDNGADYWAPSLGGRL